MRPVAGLQLRHGALPMGADGEGAEKHPLVRRRVDEEARQFVERQLPHLYEEGGRTAAEALGV
ncbi:hypothetical protein GCM10010394_15110 [Streptomyces crystallinus]|uniref:Uncharacterized protein n=1 Tax=Streptomyces crystallinus TaxID=68191 RepID=A0ABN1FBA6_9ACTN